MKKLISTILTATLALSAFPVTLAADVKSPKLSYDFDGTVSGLSLEGGAVLGAGKNGKGLMLDGTDDYALLPKDIVSEKMTITSWVKLSKLNTWGRLFDFGESSGDNFFFAPYSGGASRAEIKINGVADTMDCSEETAKDVWVHYAVTIDKNSMSLYRNGRPVKTKTGLKQNISQLKNTLNYIGKSHYDGDSYLAGTIDDFSIYDDVLTQDEILSVMGQSLTIDDFGTILDSYSIEDEQVILGDSIELPSMTSGKISVSWQSASSAVDTKTGKVSPSDTSTTAQLTCTVSDGTTSESKAYTIYIPGKNESPYSISIDASDRSKPISDIMWGLFFEDINSAADGGLYAEMIQNRSFSFEDPFYSYTLSNAEGIKGASAPLNENNPTYATITAQAGGYIANDGFMGMYVEKEKHYNFSMYAKGSYDGDITIKLLDENNAEIASALMPKCVNESWEKLETQLTASKTTEAAKLAVVFDMAGTADIDMVSLFPEDTYKNRENGLRKDLVAELEKLNPKFLRFPGGCAVEGRTMDLAWNWKDTIGDVAERKEMENIWNTGSEPYIMSYGLGFYEYFLLCQDLGMEAVPIINCGIACQVRSGSSKEEQYLVPLDELQPYIQDALDLIEFANGTDTNNEWVQKRIEMGHEQPFNIKYIGIGNEQYGEIYFERYELFAKAIHEKYPDIKLVTTSGTASSGNSNDLAWNWANANTEYANLMDEHYYESADWFRSHAYRYDNYKRVGTDVFLGEYASKGNTWYNALSEASFMTGLERNADVVKMASYAPMFAKYGNTQWTAADMIWFNNADYVLTPNYYIQSLFSNNAGDYSLNTSTTANFKAEEKLSGGISIGTWKTTADFKDISVTDSNGGILFDGDAEKLIFSTGDWNINSDGSISQKSEDESCVAYFPADWENYTVTLQARKTGGKEGFLIGAAVTDDKNQYWANIGGWTNTATKLQQVVNGTASTISNVAEQAYTSSITAKDNEWQDIRVEVGTDNITAYVDGELACSYIKPAEYGPIYSSSVFDDDNGDIIVKIANTSNADTKIDINTENAEYLSTNASVTIMQGDDSDENTLENKNNIVPSQSTINHVSDKFTYTAPKNSFTVMRIPTAKAQITKSGNTITSRPVDNEKYTVVAVRYDTNGTMNGMFMSEPAAGEINLHVNISQNSYFVVYAFDSENNCAAKKVLKSN